MLWPTGMVSVLNGTIDDGYNGLLGWFWVGCTALTLMLVRWRGPPCGSASTPR